MCISGHVQMSLLLQEKINNAQQINPLYLLKPLLRSYKSFLGYSEKLHEYAVNASKLSLVHLLDLIKSHLHTSFCFSPNANSCCYLRSLSYSSTLFFSNLSACPMHTFHVLKMVLVPLLLDPICCWSRLLLEPLQFNGLC